MGGRGSSSAGNMGGSAAANKTLKRIINRTANLKKEQYRIIDENGNELIMRKGEQHNVSLTVGEKREYLDGNTSIHNHPAGGTFSPDDIRDFGYGAREIVVAAPEGTYRLINTKFGTREQADGWMGLQEGASKIAEKSSYTNRVKKANEIINKSKEGKRLSQLSDTWTKKKKAGASQAELDKIYKDYDNLSEKVKEMKAKVLRELEVAPYHEYYKTNAKKYGFRYVFAKK